MDLLCFRQNSNSILPSYLSIFKLITFWDECTRDLNICPSLEVSKTNCYRPLDWKRRWDVQTIGPGWWSPTHHSWRSLQILVRAIASLSLPDGQDKNISSIFSHFPVGSLSFPQSFVIFFLILVFWVGPWLHHWILSFWFNKFLAF